MADNIVIIYFIELNDEIARGIRVYYNDNILCNFHTAVDTCEFETFEKPQS